MAWKGNKTIEQEVAKRNVAVKVRGVVYHLWRIHKKKLLAMEDAGDAREMGYLARVIPKTAWDATRWIVVVRKKV